MHSYFNGNRELAEWYIEVQIFPPVTDLDSVEFGVVLRIIPSWKNVLHFDPIALMSTAVCNVTFFTSEKVHSETCTK